MPRLSSTDGSVDGADDGCEAQSPERQHNINGSVRVTKENDIWFTNEVCTFTTHRKQRQFAAVAAVGDSGI